MTSRVSILTSSRWGGGANDCASTEGIHGKTAASPSEWSLSHRLPLVFCIIAEHFSAHENDRVCVSITGAPEIAYYKQRFGKQRSGFVVESLHEKPNLSSLRFGLDGRVQRAPVKADEDQVSACRYVDITNPNHDGN